MQKRNVSKYVLALLTLGGVGSWGCAADAGGPDDAVGANAEELGHWSAWRERQESNARGEELWFDATFGGEKFFAWLGSPAGDPAILLCSTTKDGLHDCN